MKRVHLGTISILAGALFVTPMALAADWEPVGDRIKTRWAAEVSPDNALPEYPRPQMVRDKWINLNGLWDYAIVGRHESQPEKFDGEILVPFALESSLSGVGKKAGADKRLWYRRTVQVPSDWAGQRVLLHFGAVDWESTVWVNGVEVGDHRGGYDPFSFDITHALNDMILQEIVVAVWDPTDDGRQARGKQVNETHGFWYTSVTGIWQTAWLEPVAVGGLSDLEITPDVDDGAVTVRADGDGLLTVRVKDGSKTVAEAGGPAGQALTIDLPDAKLWSPDSPFLYDLELTLTRGGETVDEVGSYFGMRKISLCDDEHGVKRLCLNNEVLFQLGMLDQGWWPESLYTAPTDEALVYDLKVTKDLGFNMLRKHGKLEPSRFFYWADTLGVLVWQDMIPGDMSRIQSAELGTDRDAQSAYQFEREWARIIDAVGNHPSIVVWAIFNEGWGQYDTERLAAFTKSLDPTRLVDSVSGFTDVGAGDIHDVHSYPGPVGAPNEANRAVVLGEFGGLGLPVEGHTWKPKDSWGYRSFTKAEDLTEAYETLFAKLPPYISAGISAVIYTQISDVEIEINGHMTYDRELIKMNPRRVARAARKLFNVDYADSVPVVASSQETGHEWRYTMEEPTAGWEQADFDDSSWPSAPGGFGDPDDYGMVVRTDWTTPEIWMRRTIDWPEKNPKNPHLFIYNEFEQASEVYFNGRKVGEAFGGQYSMNIVPLTKADVKAMKAGENVIAVHSERGERRQYIDIAIVDLQE
jgi:beta-galactosidase/beta-glucuronidase